MNNDFKVAFTAKESIVQELTLVPTIEEAFRRMPKEGNECLMVVQNGAGLRTENVTKRMQAFSRALALQIINSKPFEEYPHTEKLRKLADEYTEVCAGWIDEKAFLAQKKREIDILCEWVDPRYPGELMHKLPLPTTIRFCLDRQICSITTGIQTYLHFAKTNQDTENIGKLFIPIVKDLFEPNSSHWLGED